jgi:hypothetical protein
MSRSCTICQHLKRPEIDRRLANGEPAAPIAHAYKRSESSVHRHRKKCLKLGSSNLIKKEAAQGSAARALLPSKENLSGSYSELIPRTDEIVTQAQGQDRSYLLHRNAHEWPEIAGPLFSYALSQQTPQPFAARN